MKLSFLGFGEAASSIAEGLSLEGLGEMKAFDVLLNIKEKESQVLAKMEKCNVIPIYSPEEVVQGADIVLTAVPANFSVTTANSAVAGMKKGCIYIDVTTASPEEKRKIESIVESNGALFVDGAMLGPLLKYKHKVPMLLSGNGSAEFKRQMDQYHMDLTIVDGPAGVATSIKFVRSISAKGIACVLFETMQAAQFYHIEDMIVDSLCESYGKSFEQVIDGYISGTCIHAKRREHEMQNVEDMLKESNLPYQMVNATKEKLAEIADMHIADRFDGKVPRNWRGVLDGWKLN